MTQLLIVSHNPLQGELIKLTLQSPQINIHTIDNQQCILELCLREQIDLIIFLTISPYFTSMNIVDALRGRLPKLPSIYVISASHSTSTLLTLLECGVNQYLSFPLNLYRLRDKVYEQLHIQ